MRIECTTDQLKKLLSFAEKFSGKNTTLPILSGVLFLIEEKKVAIKATNLEMGFEGILPAKTSGEGSFIISPQILTNILSSLPGSSHIILEDVKGNIHFSGGGNKATIKCLPTEDFPLIPPPPREHKFQIPSKDLLQGIQSVLFAASSGTTRPETSSVYIYPEGKTIIFVSTDSIRLAEKKVASKKSNEFPPFILPSRTALEVARVCESDTENQEITIALNENQITFMFKGIEISSRLTGGHFPDYTQIIPKGHTTELVVLKQDLLNALKIANTFSDKFHKIFFSIQQKQVILTTENPDVGKNETALSAAVTGDPLEISFNQRHVGDCLPSIAQDSVTLSFSGEGKPLMVRGVGDASFTYLVAPLAS